MKRVGDVFVTGGTGYIGQRLIEALLGRGHRVRALARQGSAGRLPAGATPIIGDALEAASFAAAVRSEDTLVHLIGTPHPNPAKAAEFRRVDLGSLLATVAVARQVGVAHFVYVSVAQPAPIMKAYVEARAAGEQAIREAGLTATVLRPWYVLGPGRRWPVILLPLYAMALRIPALRDGASRCGLITVQQMVGALAHAVEEPPPAGEVRVLEVPEIRQFR